MKALSCTFVNKEIWGQDFGQERTTGAKFHWLSLAPFSDHWRSFREYFTPRAYSFLDERTKSSCRHSTFSFEIMQRKKGNDEKAGTSTEGAGGSGKRQSSRTTVVSRAMRVVSSEARLVRPEKFQLHYSYLIITIMSLCIIHITSFWSHHCALFLSHHFDHITVHWVISIFY